jgi:hypothetical protein
MRKPVLLVVVAGLVASTAACGNDKSGGDKSGGDKSDRTVAATQPGAVPAAAPTEAKEPLTATVILEKLRAAKLGLTNGSTQTEDDDPNNLLGRPDGYVSRASADLPGGDRSGERYSVGRGLVIEVFDSADLAQRRSDYIKGLQRESPVLGTEWHYRTADGTGLVRVSGDVKPSLAKKVEAAVAGPDSTTDDLKLAVKAYSDAFLTGDAKTAYDLLSERCRKRMPEAEFTGIVDAAEKMYGSALPLQTYSAKVSGDLARVTYTYSVKAINQESEPWAREDGAWHQDDC